MKRSVSSLHARIAKHKAAIARLTAICAQSTLRRRLSRVLRPLGYGPTQVKRVVTILESTTPITRRRSKEAKTRARVELPLIPKVHVPRQAMTDELRLKVRELAATGKTGKQIARALGLTLPAVYAVGLKKRKSQVPSLVAAR